MNPSQVPEFSRDIARLRLLDIQMDLLQEKFKVHSWRDRQASKPLVVFAVCNVALSLTQPWYLTYAFVCLSCIGMGVQHFRSRRSSMIVKRMKEIVEEMEEIQRKWDA